MHRRPPSRTRRLVALTAVLLLVAAGCGDDDDGGGGDTATGADSGTEDLGSVRVGLVCGGLTPLVAQVAMNADAFADTGVEVEKICFDGGSEGIQAMIGGSIDTFLGSYEHVQSTRDQGLDTKGYAVINNRYPYYLLTKADSGISSVEDLAGETVGVTSPGSLSETGLRAAMAEAGLEDDAVTVIGVGSGATSRAALDNDQVAAAMVSDPGRSELTQSGEYEILWDPEFDYVSIVAVAREGWVADNEEAFSTFLATLQDTAEQIKDDPEMALEAMKEEGFGVDDAALEEAVERGIEAIPDGLRVDESAVEGTAKILIDVGKLDPPGVPFDEGFDFSFLG